ncbi:MAG: ribonuclease Y [Bdellovibrio sp.]|nr:MAG: ribonuclease Y [Bdellovibrio sp.]
MSNFNFFSNDLNSLQFLSPAGLSLLFLALVLGALPAFLTDRLVRRSRLKAAQLAAQEILDQTREEVELQELERKERTQEIEDEVRRRVEGEMLAIEERIEDLESLIEERRQKMDQRVHQEKSRLGQEEREVNLYGDKVKVLENRFAQRKSRNESAVKEIVDRLCKKLEQGKEAYVEKLGQQMIEETELGASRLLSSIEEETQEYVEDYAKLVLDRALSRFHRPYCPERGIPPVYFANAEQRKFLVDANGHNLQTLAECTGCDVIVDETMDLVGVAGFDPVRRELTRRVLERCLKERKPIKPEFIRRTCENIKRELFSLIRIDGDSLAKELRLEGLHPEVRQMMGSLRYRYSFTQNQYFHCGEVGWLCGLLAQELGTVDFKKARRSGMLHDLGKSMDHELEGGHAVIGANFIQARGEAPDIVHAVRAHHYDEAPSTDMAFLVIAADAISGARPGARRSTMESYNQKVTELETIAKSFEGVTDCIILNGGRECRVVVNSRLVDDLKALTLTRKIADRIQEECNYPGQIKVVVVRETVVAEMTKSGMG